MAQSYGFGLCCLNIEQGQVGVASTAYIIGVREGKVDVSHLAFNDGDILDIFVCAERVMGGFTSFKGEIRLKGQKLVLAVAKVRIFFEEKSTV